MEAVLIGAEVRKTAHGAIHTHGETDMGLAGWGAVVTLGTLVLTGWWVPAAFVAVVFVACAIFD